MFRLESLGAWVLILAMTAAQPALSQGYPDDGTGVIEDDARTIYGEAYFRPFNAITVEDVLRRIPGIQDGVSEAQTVSTQRGFGSSGAQILFNGRRLSSKSMTTDTTHRWRVRALTISAMRPPSKPNEPLFQQPARAA